MTKTALFVKAKRLLIVGAIALVVISVLVLVFGRLVGSSFGGNKNVVFRVKADSSSCWAGLFNKVARQGCGNGEYVISSSMNTFTGSIKKISEDDMPVTLQLIIDGTVVDQSLSESGYELVSVSGSG